MNLLKGMTTKKLTLNAMMIALVFLATYCTKIPTAVGPFNLGDSVIIVTAFILGRKSGFIAGALGSFIADIAMGYAIFAPVTFFVKGLEGFIIGLIVHSIYNKVQEGEINKMVIKLAAIITGSLIMIGGYFFAELYVLKIFDKTMGLTKALTDLPVNIIQGAACSVIGYIVVTLLERYKISRFIEN